MKTETMQCEKCGRDFEVFLRDRFACIKKTIYCPRHRCTPGRHRWTLVNRSILCIDCFKRRIPLAFVVQRERLKRKRDAACSQNDIKK